MVIDDSNAGVIVTTIWVTLVEYGDKCPAGASLKKSRGRDVEIGSGDDFFRTFTNEQVIIAVAG